MKKIGRILLGFLFINPTLSAQQNPIDSLTLKWETYTLKNGIQVVLSPDPTQKEISVEFWLRAGAKDEVPGQFGFAHFFEHATPYGFSKDTLLRNKFRAERTNSNAQTRKDYTRYYVQVKPGGLELALRYTAERLNADTSAINEKTIETHRTNVLNEMNRMESSPNNSPTATTIRTRITYGSGHPYGHSAYGTLKGNENFTISDVRKWYDKYVFTDNIILFIVGGFETEQTRKLIESEFGGIEKKGQVINNKFPTAKCSPGSFSLPTTAKTNFISITWPMPGWKSPDIEKLQILANVLDEKFKKDTLSFILSSGSSDLFNSYQWAGQFGLFASFSSSSDSNAVEQHLMKILNDVIKKGVSENELKLGKQKAISNIKQMQATLGFISSRTELLGEGLLYANDPGYYLLRLKRQLNLTTKDIQKIAKKYFSKNGARLLLVSGI